MSSDKIIALQIANDILRGYAKYTGLKADEYTSSTIQLAELIVSWGNGETSLHSVREFFNRQ